MENILKSIEYFDPIVSNFTAGDNFRIKVQEITFNSSNLLIDYVTQYLDDADVENFNDFDNITENKIKINFEMINMFCEQLKNETNTLIENIMKYHKSGTLKTDEIVKLIHKIKFANKKTTLQLIKIKKIILNKKTQIDKKKQNFFSVNLCLEIRSKLSRINANEPSISHKLFFIWSQLEFLLTMNFITENPANYTRKTQQYLILQNFYKTTMTVPYAQSKKIDENMTKNLENFKLYILLGKHTTFLFDRNNKNRNQITNTLYEIDMEAFFLDFITSFRKNCNMVLHFLLFNYVKKERSFWQQVYKEVNMNLKVMRLFTFNNSTVKNIYDNYKDIRLLTVLQNTL